MMQVVAPGVPLGKTQQQVLMKARQHYNSQWSAGTWVWNTEAGTQKLFEQLTKRGLAQRFVHNQVTQSGIVYGQKLVFKLTNKGEEVADALIAKQQP